MTLIRAAIDLIDPPFTLQELVRAVPAAIVLLVLLFGVVVALEVLAGP